MDYHKDLCLTQHIGKRQAVTDYLKMYTWQHGQYCHADQ